MNTASRPTHTVVRVRENCPFGYDGEYLSGASGNDELCAWGGGNVLDGGSGNDVLIVMDGTGNTLLGGSGNDTLIGFEGDVFDGGSGNNQVIRHERISEIEFTLIWTWTPGKSNFAGVLSGRGLQPEADVTLVVELASGGNPLIASVGVVNDDGTFYSSDLNTTCGIATSISYETTDKCGNPISVIEPLPC